jgi:hypothetical protein
MPRVGSSRDTTTRRGSMTMKAYQKNQPRQKFIGIRPRWRRRRATWDDYEAAKSQISQQCGWDAPPSRQDEDEYARRISRWLEENGL